MFATSFGLEATIVWPQSTLARATSPTAVRPVRVSVALVTPPCPSFAVSFTVAAPAVLTCHACIPTAQSRSANSSVPSAPTSRSHLSGSPSGSLAAQAKVVENGTVPVAGVAVNEPTTGG